MASRIQRTMDGQIFLRWAFIPQVVVVNVGAIPDVNVDKHTASPQEALSYKLIFCVASSTATPRRGCRNLETARVSCCAFRRADSPFTAMAPTAPLSSSVPSKRTKPPRRLTMEKKAAIIKQVQSGRSQTEAAVSPQVDSVCDELPSVDVAFDDLRAAGVSIPAGITFEGFADADKDLELCAKLTDDEIIRQVTEDSDDSDSENEEPAPTQPTSSELTQALMTLSSVYSGNMTLTEIEADMIAGKRNAMQKKISDIFAPKC
ncbi:hypothetical protein HPB52_017113 [Rhipicephalus sanguineus]|uniref:Uncharacterized protein n=1 Tax=Rhipicephalus sanguineus TaxID=34632 RepID=A0A9D4SZB8_RHISA|nr:hypothetical protein HPB52_017113 [Rhipicephalus sanguineus]